ncbi:MAG: ilvE 1 [Candidatus Kaiserbacteria bacterium]|nr:ilvE 1 [Candidatus Kaiserbacteria bacterium]
MARMYEKVYFGDTLVDSNDANLSVGSSAVLYGLSVYTVFPVCKTAHGLAAFRLSDHYKRLVDSAKIMGIDTFVPDWSFERFEKVAKELIQANSVTTDVFVRATVHVSELIPGTRSRGLTTTVSMFIYDATPIVPQTGARLKTSVWRRVPDYAIPSRAKVNGAYVNSVLARQDALDSGYDDCVFLDCNGHVCEASAANIFLVRDGVLITPDTSSDILEGINRRTILAVARDMNIPTVERVVDLTELYVADEVFLCGTSAYIAPIKTIDARDIKSAPGTITARLQEMHTSILHGTSPMYQHFLTQVG